MIRKQTWILLGIFIVMVGAAFYLQKNPIKNSARITPSPTTQASILNGWLASDIIKIAYQDSQKGSVQLEQDAKGNWILQPDGLAVGIGKIEEIRTQLVDTRVMESLDPGYDLAGVGLTSPTGNLTVTSAKGNQAEIRIGKQTPTGSGYYVEINQGAPSVVSSGAIDSLLDLLRKDRLLDLTPTPMVSPSPEITKTPG